MIFSTWKDTNNNQSRHSIFLREIQPYSYTNRRRGAIKKRVYMYRPQSFFHLQTSEHLKRKQNTCMHHWSKDYWERRRSGRLFILFSICEHILSANSQRVILEEMRDLSVRSLRSDWAWVKTKQKSTEKSIQASLHTCRYQQ